ncbi:hypothetical protein ACPOL_6976 (plasmid) [Acidisarcina polymorpha]|uniref:Uncharacterized protein n=1 Tax=Acidisarcina polymorpha TaxID=2211140 RepID=A0A2Z5GB81_9BACT|nr:hypothetical protein ACPOL_6976 [Acidisarcina polymorpha]
MIFTALGLLLSAYGLQQLQISSSASTPDRNQLARPDAE